MSPPSHKSKRSLRRRASVLLLSLVVIVLLTLGALSFFDRMFVEHQATEAHLRQTQSRLLAESGLEFIRALTMQDPLVVQQAGGLYNNPALFQGRLVIDDPSAAFRGRFTIIAPGLSEAGYFSGIRYGLDNESSRLNLNTLLLADNYGENGARNLLMSLPGMTETIADAILDWIDSDNDQRQLGAEQEYYSSLSPAYAPRNGPLGSIEELLLVRDVTPALLFGADLNRNSLIETNEEPYTAIPGVDNSTGSLNRGWAAYLTIDSAEKNTKADGTPKIDINMQDLQELHKQALTVLTEAEANFIVAYRQGGPEEANSGGGNNPAGNTRTVDAASLDLDFALPGRERLNNLLDLIGVRTRVVDNNQQQQGGQPGQPQNQQTTVCESPFKNEPSAMRVFIPKLFDNFAVNSSASIPGRININQAPRPLLIGIPGMDSMIVDQIIAMRLPVDDGQRPEQKYEVWPLMNGMVELEQMKQLMPLVTAGGDVYRAQVIGYFDEGGPAYRVEAVIDGTSATPVVKRRRDLVDQGPGYTLETLGVTVDEAE